MRTVTESRNYLLRYAEEKERQRRKQVEHWIEVRTRIMNLPQNPRYAVLAQYCQDQIEALNPSSREASNDLKFHAVLLNNMLAIAKLTETELNGATKVDASAKPVVVPPPPTPIGPIAGETDPDDDDEPSVKDDLDDDKEETEV